ncbi:MAG: hypothetical protein ACRDJN_12940 [Chloroflexota bacterium]
MNRLLPGLAALLLVGCSDVPTETADPAVSPSFSHQAGSPSSHVFLVTLQELNGSGVEAQATLRVTDEELIVRLNAVGLVSGQLHPQHIHGFSDAASTCPTSAQDTDGDGIITIGEGSAAFGPVQVDLQPYPTPANAAAAAPYERAFDLDDVPFAASELTQKTMVVHGAFVDGAYVASLPVACGFVEALH